GPPPTVPGSARRACSTACSCRSGRSGPGATRTRTTSPLTKTKREVARRPASAAIPSGWEYAPAPESRDIVRVNESYGLYIGGEFVEPLSNERYTTIDPSREEPLSEIAQAGKADVDRAVKSAREAYAERWSNLRAGARRGQHGRAQAGGDDAALGAALLRRRPSGRAAAGRCEHRDRRWPHRR